MTPADFIEWRQTMGLTQAQAGEALGLSHETVALYDSGKRRGVNPRPVTIPRTVALACAALYHRMEPWGE